MDTLNPYSSPKTDLPAEQYVRAEIFRGTTLSWFCDRYEFYVPEIDEVTSQVVAFFEATKARVIAREPLTFWRGNLWSSLLGPERYARQRIVVKFDLEQHRVHLEYHINMVLPTRVYYSSHNEAVRLATELGAVHPEGVTS